MRLLLIRHGQTPSNILSLLDTARPGAGLTDLGVEQAAALPAALADHRIDAIYASTLPRAQLTARPLAEARGLPVHVRDGLREVGAGDLEMRGDAEAIGIYQGTLRRWMSGELEIAMPGGETGAQVLARFDEVVDEVVETLRGHADDDGSAALFAHGAMLRFWATVRGTDLATIEDAVGRRHGLHNTGMIELVGLPGGGWTVVSWAGLAIGGPRLDDGSADGPTGQGLATIG